MDGLLMKERKLSLDQRTHEGYYSASGINRIHNCRHDIGSKQEANITTALFSAQNVVTV